MPQFAPRLNASLLVVHPEIGSPIALSEFLTLQDYRVTECSNVTAACEKLERDSFDLVIVAGDLSDHSRFDLTKVAEQVNAEVLVLSDDYGPRPEPIEADRLTASAEDGEVHLLEEAGDLVRESLARHRNAFKGDIHSNGGSGRTGTFSFKTNGRTTPFKVSPAFTPIGESPVMKQLLVNVRKIAPTNSSVLITGATGTGKEVIARLIHEQSPRRGAQLIDINCSAIPDSLVESELFGHQRGTFTGAHETRRGLFEEASGGTIFLDEIDALNLSAQAKLLRVIQERRVRRVGGRENIPIDVRIISATNRDLAAAVTEGLFRSDLLFRLRVVPLHVPDLRQRGDDIKLLARHFLRCHSERQGAIPRHFSEDAMRAMTSYRWPGNVRELENAIEYALAVSEGDVLTVHDLPPEVLRGSDERDEITSFLSSDMQLAEVERRYILAVYKRNACHQIKTAAALGIDRRTLYRKLQQYGALTRAKTFVSSI